MFELHNYEQPFYTIDAYWECDCSSNFVHPKTLTECPRCGGTSDECPDARLSNLLPLVETGDQFWVILKPGDKMTAVHGIYDSAEQACEAAKREVSLDNLMLINQIQEKGGKADISSYMVATDGYAVLLDTELDGKKTHDIHYWVMGYNKNSFYGYPLWRITKGA